MSNINHVVIAGNLVRDPDIRFTQQGTCILSFTLAVGESRKNQNGQWENVPHFFDCTMWGARAESLGDMLLKGMKVTVSGRLRQESWEKDGRKHSKVSILVNDVELPPRDRSAHPSYGAQRYKNAPQTQQTADYATQARENAQGLFRNDSGRPPF